MQDDTSIHIALYEALSKLAHEDEIYVHAGAVNGRGSQSTGRRMLEVLRSLGFDVVRKP